MHGRIGMGSGCIGGGGVGDGGEDDGVSGDDSGGGRVVELLHRALSKSSFAGELPVTC